MGEGVDGWVDLWVLGRRGWVGDHRNINVCRQSPGGKNVKMCTRLQMQHFGICAQQGRRFLRHVVMLFQIYLKEILCCLPIL